MKNIPGDLSRPSLVGTSAPSMEDPFPRAGYPTVPEYGGIYALTLEIMSGQNSAWRPLCRKFTEKVRV